MIIYWLAVVGISILGAVLSPLLFLPDVSLPSWINQGVNGAIQAFSTFHAVLPYTADMLLGLVVFLAGMTASIWVYKAVKWVYNKIPGVN